jgi:hypothetical protein
LEGGNAGRDLSEECEDVGGSLCQVIRSIRFGKGKLLRKESDGVGVASSARGGKKTLETAIVFHGRSDIPSFFAMIGPTGSFVGLEVQKDFGARGCQRSGVEIKVPEEVGMGG